MDFAVLGRVEARHAGREVPLGGARQRRLLAMFLLNGPRAISLERLEQELWADPPATARQQVHNAVAALRRALRVDPEAIEIRTTDAGYLAVFDPARVDLGRHRALEQAARAAEADGRAKEAIEYLTEASELWRGPALAGARGRYLDRLAARLEEERLDAAHRRYALQLSTEDAGAAVGPLAALVDDNPLQEPLRGLLMLALFRAGRPVEALDAYEEGRRLLVDELGVDPSAQLQRLQQLILLGQDPGELLGIGSPLGAGSPLGVPTSGAVGSGQGPAGGSPRSSLPFAIQDFAGRAVELELAAAAAGASAGVSVCVVDGLGGIGKTAFATSLAHRLADRYPDGQYFLDLHGFTTRQEPMAPATALDILLRAMGAAHDRIPATLDARVELWRAETAGRQLLLVLDNVADEAQVRPLMPGASDAFVLITSRRRLVELDTSLTVSLDALPPAEASALFRTIVGPGRCAGQDESIAEAVDLCGRLPLALRVAAARFRARPSWTVAHLIEVLRDAGRRAQVLSYEGRSIAEVLGFSYQHLDRDRRRAFRLLSVIPGADFDSVTAAALLDLPRDQAAGDLEKLLEDNLLVSHAPDRYGFHDLLKDFARDLMDKKDGDEAGGAAERRLLRHYEHVVRTCTAFIDSGADGRSLDVDRPDAPFITSSADATAWLEREYGNLMAASRRALARGHRAYSWRLPCAMDPFLVLQNRREEWRAIFSAALDPARADGNRAGEATLLAALGVMDRDRGAHEEGKRLLMEAAGISRELGDKSGEALRVAGVGIIELREGHLQNAYDCFAEARGLSLEAGDVRSHAAFTSNLSAICGEFGRLDEAVALAGEALDVFRQSSHPQAESLAGINMGRALLKRGQYPAAAEHLQDALDLSRRITYRNGHACAGAWLAMATTFTGPPAEGLRHGEEARRIAQEYDVRDVECEALLALGWLRRSMSEFAAAEGHFRAVLDIAEQDSLQVHQAWAEDGLAHVALARDQHPVAREHWTRALALHSPEGDDAAITRSHLDALAGPPVTCWRCAPPSRRAAEPSSR